MAERAAALWLAQIGIYADAIDRFANVRSLDAEKLFASPREVIEAAFALFGLAAAPREIDAVVAGDLFARHAKDPNTRFDNQARLSRRQAASKELAADIEAARRWLQRFESAGGVPAQLARPLTGESPELLAPL